MESYDIFSKQGTDEQNLQEDSNMGEVIGDMVRQASSEATYETVESDVLRELPSNSELRGKLEVHRRKSSEDSELGVRRRKSSEDSELGVQRRKSSEDSELEVQRRKRTSSSQATCDLLEVQRRKRTSSSQATWDLVDLSGPEHREEQDIEECEPPCSTMQSEAEALPSVAKDSVYLSKTSTNTWDMVDAVEPDHSEKRSKD